MKIEKELEFSRKEIYEMVWEKPVRLVAEEIGVRYSDALKMCKENQIPTPPSGYWTKIQFGKDVSDDVVELTGDEHKKVTITQMVKTEKPISKTVVESSRNGTIQSMEETKDNQTTNSKSKIEDEYSKKLYFLREEEKTKVIKSAIEITVKEGEKSHRRVVEYKKKLQAYKKEQGKKNNHYGYGYRNNQCNEKPIFFDDVSESGLKRILVIMSTLFKAAEALGGTINADLSIQFGKDAADMVFIEYKDKIEHELTKEEAKQLVEYNDAIKQGRYAWKPQIPKYDKPFNGRLRVNIRDGYYYRDKGEDKIESHIGDLLIDLFIQINDTKEYREQREEQERIRAEEEERKRQLKERIEVEKENTRALINKAEDFRIACEIRAYITEEKQKGEVDSDWIEWALAKADWVDPTIDKEDVLLGKRNHEKSNEEKTDDLKKINKYSYW